MRDRALRVWLVLVGLFFAGVTGYYGIFGDLWHAAWRLPGHNEVTAMFASVYVTLGIFLLLAARNPAPYRLLIAFAAWSSLAHAAVMAVQAAQAAAHARSDFLWATLLFAVIGAVLLLLAPRRAVRAAPAAA